MGSGIATTRSGLARRGTSDAALRAVQDELSATLHVELVVDVVQMRFHGGLADEQPLGDAPVAQAARDEPRDLSLARGQDRSDLPRARFPLEQPVECPGGRPALDPQLPSVYFPQALQEEAGRHLLQYHAA